MIVIFKILLKYYQCKIHAKSDVYDRKLSRIVDCLQYIVDTLKEEKS